VGTGCTGTQPDVRHGRRLLRERCLSRDPHRIFPETFDAPDPDGCPERKPQPRRSSMRAFVPVLVLILATAGCGDGPAGLDDQLQTITGTVSVFGTTEHAISTSRAGTLDVTLTWANPAIDLDLYLTGPQCTGYPPTDCTLLASSDRFTGTSENIQRTVASGEQFKVWVDNWDEALPSNYTLTVRVR
jgi:hypothetical protein